MFTLEPLQALLTSTIVPGFPQATQCVLSVELMKGCWLAVYRNGTREINGLGRRMVGEEKLKETFEHYRAEGGNH